MVLTPPSLKGPTLLSLPPEASSWWSVDHLRPHTSCRWPCSRRSACRGGVRTSRCRIRRSRLPEDSCSAFQARAPGGQGHERKQGWTSGRDWGRAKTLG